MRRRAPVEWYRWRHAHRVGCLHSAWRMQRGEGKGSGEALKGPVDLPFYCRLARTAWGRVGIAICCFRTTGGCVYDGSWNLMIWKDRREAIVVGRSILVDLSISCAGLLLVGRLEPDAAWGFVSTAVSFWGRTVRGSVTRWCQIGEINE
jgi:hypothetical protein